MVFPLTNHQSMFLSIAECVLSKVPIKMNSIDTKNSEFHRMAVHHILQVISKTLYIYHSNEVVFD